MIQQTWRAARISAGLVLRTPAAPIGGGLAAMALFLSRSLPFSGALGPELWSELIIASGAFIAWLVTALLVVDLQAPGGCFPGAMLGSSLSRSSAAIRIGSALGCAGALCSIVGLLILVPPAGERDWASMACIGLPTLVGTCSMVFAVCATVLLLARALPRSPCVLVSLAALLLGLSPEIWAALPQFEWARVFFFPVSPGDWLAEDRVGGPGTAPTIIAGMTYDLGLALLLLIGAPSRT